MLKIVKWGWSENDSFNTRTTLKNGHMGEKVFENLNSRSFSPAIFFSTLKPILYTRWGGCVHRLLAKSLFECVHFRLWMDAIRDRVELSWCCNKRSVTTVFISLSWYGSHLRNIPQYTNLRRVNIVARVLCLDLFLIYCMLGTT